MRKGVGRLYFSPVVQLTTDFEKKNKIISRGTGPATIFDMTQKPRHVLMLWDDLAWEQSDATANAWERAQLHSDSFRAVAKFIDKHGPGKPLSPRSPSEEITTFVTA